MKRLALAVLMSLAVPVATVAQAVPEIPFESVPDFLKLPQNVYLGEVAGVAVNSKGHVFVFSRGNTTGAAYGAAAAQLLEFGPDGTYVRAPKVGPAFSAQDYLMEISQAARVEPQ